MLTKYHAWVIAEADASDGVTPGHNGVEMQEIRALVAKGFLRPGAVPDEWFATDAGRVAVRDYLAKHLQDA